MFAVIRTFNVTTSSDNFVEGAAVTEHIVVTIRTTCFNIQNIYCAYTARLWIGHDEQWNTQIISPSSIKLLFSTICRMFAMTQELNCLNTVWMQFAYSSCRLCCAVIRTVPLTKVMCRILLQVGVKFPFNPS